MFFQPLLYQVATPVLAPSQMSSPMREVLRRHKNTTVIMGEVTGVNKAQRCVFVNDADRQHVPVRYDYLVLATGARHSYFGHDEFEEFAAGLKTQSFKKRAQRYDSLLMKTRCWQQLIRPLFQLSGSSQRSFLS